MESRFFYHSFPRRGKDSPDVIDKGCLILEAIRDLGLLMVPEQIEWKQPYSDRSSFRPLGILQRRVCFTELAPHELLQHSKVFGEFSLEFDLDAVRTLGAIPVFYLPDPNKEVEDGSDFGASLVAIALDALALVGRMAMLQKLFESKKFHETFDFNTGFTLNPDLKQSVVLNTEETKKVIAALGHGLTPLNNLTVGLGALTNFFYPADNRVADAPLHYYRQHEWRAACSFTVRQQEVTRALTQSDREQILQIDNEFFSRQISTHSGPVERLGECLILPGLNGKRVIEMVRRVIVPPCAVEQVKSILAALDKPPAVVSLDSL